jgi:ABC-2 type transport system permease protein
MFVAQLIIAAISTEKIDKTLETLLSTPVSRISVLTSKMLAAALVALINAAAYMFGFSSMMGTMTADITSELGGDIIPATDTVTDAVRQLGLIPNAGDFFLIGLQLFFTILIVLSVSLILGAMVTDMKGAQTVMLPILITAMLPYILSLTTGIDNLSAPLKIFVYIIPFTHSFNAAGNVLFGNMAVYWAGLAYQVLFFTVCMYLALKLFTSDKIFTSSLNFGRKKLKTVS